MEETKDIMQYLMTSDFDEDGTSFEEYILLLKEFRSKYRRLDGQNKRLVTENQEIIKKTNRFEKSNKELKQRNDKLLNMLKQYRIKKLSLKERITGKIRNI